MKVDKKYRSYYYRFRNQILDWLPSDSEELYKENYKNCYSELERYGWIDNHFTYKFNSYGFRCEEFNDEPTMMTLGCSVTLGIGLPFDKIWPELLAKNLGLRCANLGIGGAGADTAFRMCLGYIDIVKPKIIVLFEPHRGRMELFNETNPPTLIGTWHTNNSETSDSIENFAENWLSSDYNDYFNQEKNILAIKHLCEKRNIKFIHDDSVNLLNRTHLLGNYPLARDLAHVGVENHKLIAKKLLLKI
jgi:hypothetical protein